MYKILHGQGDNSLWFDHFVTPFTHLDWCSSSIFFFFIGINLSNSMHALSFQQSSNNYKYLYLLLFQSHCRWDSLFQTCLSFPVFQSRYRMRLSILEVDSHRTGVIVFCTHRGIVCCTVHMLCWWGTPDLSCPHRLDCSESQVRPIGTKARSNAGGLQSTWFQ